MQYLCLIYEVESEMLARSEDEQSRIMADYWAFTSDIKEKGQFVAGEALMPTETATTVRIRDGKRVATDGPFAETKEQLGGFYLLECKDLDETIELAGRIPSSKYGSIEVRPVMVFDQ